MIFILIFWLPIYILIYIKVLIYIINFENMKIKNKSVLCIGEVLWDRLPSGAKPGGAPLNVAIHLNAIGLNVSIASSVGNDEAGQELISFIRESGLDTGLIQVNKHLPTSEVLVHLDKQNNATYEICEPVAWDQILPAEALVEHAQQAGLIIFGSLASRNTITRETVLKLLQSNAVKLIDVNLRKPYDKKEILEVLLPKSDIIKLNDIELIRIAEWLTIDSKNEKQLVKGLADYYNIEMVCLTKGENGALIYNKGIFYEHPGFKVKTVDTVGAGDAFLAGLVASFLQNKTTAESLAFACATGAFVASQAGATPKYNVEKINAILNQETGR